MYIYYQLYCLVNLKSYLGSLRCFVLSRCFLIRAICHDTLFNKTDMLSWHMVLSIFCNHIVCHRHLAPCCWSSLRGCRWLWDL